jgi:xanthine/CO dehydrogenase XdhC/CoxF family maturation factor
VLTDVDTPAEIAVSILAEIVQVRAARRAALSARRDANGKQQGEAQVLVERASD